MIDRSQEQIIRSWKTRECCKVSVVCTAYNHELYIREAIDSFLMQETSFPFEIIIHDDASTDDTANIIEEYHLRYPDIIKPVYQKENQYSKGGFKPSIYAASYSRSEFIALCEGDDFWVDRQKLKIQIEAMQSHPDVDFSFHSAYCVSDGVRDSNPSWDYGCGQIFSPYSVISCVDSFAPTASYVLRREVLLRLPEWFFNIAPVGDLFMEIYGSRRGGALYLNIPMAAYRVDVENSWSSGNMIYSASYPIHWKKILRSYQFLKSDFSEYSEALGIKMAGGLSHLAAFYLFSKKYDKFRIYIRKSVNCYYSASLKQKILFFGSFCPPALRILFIFYINFISRGKANYKVSNTRLALMKKNTRD